MFFVPEEDVMLLRSKPPDSIEENSRLRSRRSSTASISFSSTKILPAVFGDLWSERLLLSLHIRGKSVFICAEISTFLLSFVTSSSRIKVQQNTLNCRFLNLNFYPEHSNNECKTLTCNAVGVHDIYGTIKA